MNEVINQLIPIFLHSESEAKSMLGNALLHTIPGIYTSGFGMIASGDPNHMVTGGLMVIGMTVLIVRGLWKILASSLAHHFFVFLSHALEPLIKVFHRRPSL